MNNQALEKKAYEAFLLHDLAIHGWSLKDVLTKLHIADDHIEGAPLPDFNEFLENDYVHHPSLMRELLVWPENIEAYMRDVTGDEQEACGIVAIDFVAHCYKEMPLEEYQWALEEDAMTNLLKDANLTLEDDIQKFMFIVEHEYAYDKSDVLIAADRIRQDYRKS